MTKKIISWALYDWANSVFFTTVMAGFFPVFFKQYWSTGVDPVVTTERLGWILSISGLILALISPTLGVLSDRRHVKKKLLFGFMVIGVFCTLGLYFIPAGQWLWAANLYGAGLFMCSASCVFYDSLMVSVCDEAQYDFVSSLGYSLGYLGGGLLFLINVLMYLQPEAFGLVDGVSGVKVSFLTVGLWWFVFTLPLMFFVPEPHIQEGGISSQQSIYRMTIDTLHELYGTLKSLTQNKNLFYFVLAYWFYIDGIFTVMSMAVDFGMSLGFASSDLIKALLITQFVGFPSAYLFGVMARKISNKFLILVCLVIYFFTIIAASRMTDVSHFYALAVVIGLSQGGVQALSRSLFAQLIPEEKSGEYFGFFNLLGKFASVFGPALIAIFSRLTSDSRQTILSLLILILFGGYFLLKVQKKTV